MEIKNIKSPEDLMTYMNEHIEYGWLDNSNKKHLNTMTDFRTLYRISSIEEIIESNCGTCIEQTKLESFIFDNLSIFYEAYCLRSYKDDESLENPKMHCFLLYFLEGEWYHFEHSNPEKRGIHKYENKESALASILAYFQKRDNGLKRELTQIKDIPDHLDWSGWNSYLDNINKSKQK